MAVLVEGVLLSVGGRGSATGAGRIRGGRARRGVVVDVRAGGLGGLVPLGLLGVGVYEEPCCALGGGRR